MNSKHGRKYTVSIKTDEIISYYLPRINSAKSGWGYKERLDFQYYPINELGTYSILAHAYNLYGNEILKTEKINIEIIK